MWAAMAFNKGFIKLMKKIPKLMIFGNQWTTGVYTSAILNLSEKLNLTSFGLQAKHFVDFNLS